MATRERATTLTKGTINLEEPAAEPLGQRKRPEKGQFRLQVDRQTKASYVTYEAAEEAGMALKNQFQMLQVQVYDAATKTRSMVEWPAPV